MSTQPAGPVIPGGGSWWREISRQARERDVRRQIRYDRARKALLRPLLENRLRDRMSPLLADYATRLLGAILAFGILGALLAWFFRPLYTYAAFGLFYSLQSAYYGYRLSRDPTFRIPRCKCAGAARDGSEVVLGSRESRTFRIPNAVLGVALYPLVIFAVRTGHDQAATLLGATAVAYGAWLGYVMVARIRALCANCINMAGLNLLILWQLLR